MGTVGTPAGLPALVIPNAGTESNVLPAASIGDFVAIALYGPGTVDGGVTYALQGHPSPKATNADTGWCTLQDEAGNTIEAPGQSAVRVYWALPVLGSIRVKASGAVGGERRWEAAGVRTS